VSFSERARVAKVSHAARVDLAEVGGAIAACDLDGGMISCSPSAHELLSRMDAAFERAPDRLPDDLFTLLSSRAVGEAIEWRASGDAELLLGCTRYTLGSDRWLLVMSEISEKQNLLSKRLHRQRLEALGSLVAATAHDLRAPLSSIVYNIDVLESRIDELSRERMRETAGDVKTAASRMKGTLDSLLEYVRAGPARQTEVTLAEILARLHSVLRPVLRSGSHALVDRSVAGADRMIGNPIEIEQIFVNLALNAVEAAGRPTTVTLSTSRAGDMVRVLVEDDGPGIADEHARQVFDPFFTTKHNGTGLGLSIAREAARAAGGDLLLVRGRGGAAFAVFLPAPLCSSGNQR
jgi:signal transduction histidine kinase